jgi:hypothetical protein
LAKRNGRLTDLAPSRRAMMDFRYAACDVAVAERAAAAAPCRAGNCYSDFIRVLIVLLRLPIVVLRLLKPLVTPLVPLPTDWIELIG